MGLSCNHPLRPPEDVVIMKKSRHDLTEYIRIRVPVADADYYKQVYGDDAEDKMRDRIHVWVDIHQKMFRKEEE